MNKPKDQTTELFVGFAQQDKGIFLSRILIDFCEGDILAALFLSQLFYWNERCNDPDGWIAKSYTDWQKETGMTEYQVKRAVQGDGRKRKKGQPLTLKDIGVQTSLRRSKFYRGAATMHYRIDFDTLSSAVHAFLDKRRDIPVLNIVQNEDHNNVQNDVADIVQNDTSSTMFRTLTENTTKTTTDTTEHNVVVFVSDDLSGLFNEGEIQQLLEMHDLDWLETVAAIAVTKEKPNGYARWAVQNPRKFNETNTPKKQNGKKSATIEDDGMRFKRSFEKYGIPVDDELESEGE